MKKEYMPFLITLIMYMVGTSAFAYDIEVKNSDGITIYYNYINNKSELEVTYKGNNTSYSGSIIIPKDVTYMNNTLKVTSIGAAAFYANNKLTSITIPNSVTIINKEAFAFCTSLKEFTIPNSLQSIGYKAFQSCKQLTSIAIPDNVITIDDFAFENCKNLSTVSFGKNLTSIGESAFDKTGLISVTIPNNVTSIGDLAFASCKSLTSITLPNKLKTINTMLCENCPKLTSVIIPNSVRTIGVAAFDWCISLTSVIIPNGVKTIDSSAFSRCYSLTSITIPSTVKEIQVNAFEETDLSVVVSEIMEPFDIFGYSSNSRVFSQPTFNNATLYVPVGTLEKYKRTNGWKDFFNIVEGSPTNINMVNTYPIVVKTQDGMLQLDGVENGMNISVYTMDGVLVCSTISRNGIASVNTHLTKDTVVIVKIGNKSMKVLIKI